MAAALRIGVIGGSIAGCAAAVAGSRAGADVTVYERSGAELQDRGFGTVVPPPLHAKLVGSGYLGPDMPTAPVGTRVWLTREPGGRSARELARQPSPVTPCNWGLLWRSLRASAGSVRYLRGQPVASVRADAAGRAVITSARGGRRATACHPVADVQAPRGARPHLLLAGDAAGVTRPHTATGAVKALQDALCLERVLREGPDPATALERYADERTAAGARSVELGRRMGRSLVEEVPDWPAMGQDEVDVWFRGVLAGTWHYLYKEPGEAAAEPDAGPEATVAR